MYDNIIQNFQVKGSCKFQRKCKCYSFIFTCFKVNYVIFLTETLEALEEGNSIIAASEIEVILAMEFTAKNLVLIIENEKEEFKILPAELDSILVNAKSILNAVATIRKLQTKKLKELTPEELLVALTT